MDKRFFASIVMLFILIITSIPFYWFAYRPKMIRQQCLALSLGTAFDGLNSREAVKEKIADYFRERVDLGQNISALSQEMKEASLFLIMQRREGYQICLELNGFKE